MKSLKEDYYNPFFSHIYVEEAVLEHPRTRAVLAAFPSARRILIHHYKDVFCRAGQSCAQQRRARKLILASKQGRLLYRGAPVCQDFGNDHFYYTSCVMNCIYDCEYCYLKGMYPSANIVMFVNLEDIFEETEALLQKHPVYLCVSYDTDLLALERITGYVREWSRFAARQSRLTLEIRTKCAAREYFRDTDPVPGVIYAFTLSPQAVIEEMEDGTPSLAARLACVAEAVRAGFAVRLCFDPLMYLPGWQRHYGEMPGQVWAAVDPDKIVDVSVGSFRISQDYLKKMRRQEPGSPVAQFPYQNDHGYCHYPDALMEQMEQYVAGELAKRIPEEKIFRWKF